MKILSCTVLVGIVALGQGCSPLKGEEVDLPVAGVILPHHALVEPFMEDFLEEMRAQAGMEAVERVILISPNHFGYGYANLQTLSSEFQSVDEAWPLEGALQERLIQRSSLEAVSDDFYLEHGITVPWALLKEHWPEATLLPITIKPGTSQAELDRLIQALEQEDLQRTVVVGSIDFSHLTPESIAAENDAATVTWLTAIPEDSTTWHAALEQLAHPESLVKVEGAVAMDSPETLYVVLKLMEARGFTAFTLWQRTSSAALTGIEDPLQNTSHLFGWFAEEESR